MSIFWTIFILFIIAFVLALFSMKDLRYGQVMQKILTKKTIRGTILFMKKKIIHFHSSKSSFSSFK